MTEIFPFNGDHPTYVEVSQNGLLDRFGIPKYSQDRPDVCAVPHVFVDRNFPFAWDFDPAKGYAINYASP